MTTTFKTARLTLRVPERSDAEAIATGLNNIEVVRWLPIIPFPYVVADAHDWLAGLAATPRGPTTFAIDLPGTRCVGCIALGKQLGYWLAERYWGQGIMTEATGLLLDWHFSVSDAEVASGAVASNVRSLALQKKLGFVATGVPDRVFVKSLGWEVDHIGTRLTRAAYEDHRR